MENRLQILSLIHISLQLGEGYQGEVKLEVEAGTYRVITTNRLPNGNQFAACTEFDIENGQTKEIQLGMKISRNMF